MSALNSLKTHDNEYIWLGNGLGIRTYQSGTRKYVVHYQDCKTMRIKTLADKDAITLEQAQTLAQAYRCTEHAQLSCDEAFGVWLARYATVKTKTWAKQQYRWNKYISPSWGHAPLISITQNDISGLIATLCNSPTLSNRLVELFSSVWNRCTEYNLVSLPNPCTKIAKRKLRSRSRYLELSEVKELIRAIQNLKDDRTKNALMLILLTGRRKSEILSLEWRNVKLESKLLVFEDTKNGNDFILPATPTIINILISIPRTSKFVFPSDSKSGHLVAIDKAFAQACEHAKLYDVCIHDLRRTLASHLAQDGISSNIVGDILDHKDPKSTAVYARLNIQTKLNALAHYDSKLNIS